MAPGVMRRLLLLTALVAAAAQEGADSSPPSETSPPSGASDFPISMPPSEAPRTAPPVDTAPPSNPAPPSEERPADPKKHVSYADQHHVSETVKYDFEAHEHKIESHTTTEALTTASPGSWSGKEASHVPMIHNYDGTFVIDVEHSAMTEEHLISELYIVNERDEIIMHEQLKPGDQPKLTFYITTMNNITKYVTPYAVCNKHGTWKGEPTRVWPELDEKDEMTEEEHIAYLRSHPQYAAELDELKQLEKEKQEHEKAHKEWQAKYKQEL